MPLITGQILNNRYLIVKLLGQGGFGAVYRAWDTALSRPCAIKENLELAAVSQRQFQLEASTLANLSHTNLPRVIDHFILPEQGQYLVMDFIDGEDLGTRLEHSGKLRWEEIRPWVEQITSAVVYLHSQPNPVIHRDIKPSNIRITPDGRAFLVDFGLVKFYDPQLRTTQGARAITPGYSPPEQYGQAITDARTDIYALAATIYRLLTGVEMPESVARLGHDPLLPARRINPGIPPHVEWALQKAMQIRPPDRFASMAEFAQALLQPISQPQQRPQPQPQPVYVSPPQGMQQPGGAAYYPGYSQPGQAATPVKKKRLLSWTGCLLIGVVILVVGLISYLGGIAMQRARQQGIAVIPTPTEWDRVVSPTETAVPPTEAPSPVPPGIAEPAEPVTITFAYPGESLAERLSTWEALAKEFHVLHPNITVHFEEIPPLDFEPILITRAASGNPPDTAYLSERLVNDYSSSSYLLPLDEYVSSWNAVDVGDYVHASLELDRNGSALFGLPINAYPLGLFYRTDRFIEAGLDPNQPPKTWADFEAIAAKLTDTGRKRYGTAVFAIEAAYYFMPWLWQAGGDRYGPDGMEITWDSAEGQEAANFYANLAKYSSPDLLSSNSWEGRQYFANGDIAMMVQGSWFAYSLMSEFPEANGKWAVAPLPAYRRCASPIFTNNLVIFSGSPHADAAFLWIAFASDPKNMALLNQPTFQSYAVTLPPRISLLDDPAIFEKQPQMKGFVGTMKCAFTDGAAPDRSADLESILSKYLGDAIHGSIDGATAVKKAADEARTLQGR